jgi:hypothetical protein
MRFQLTNATYFGLQRSIIEDKLRVGVTYHRNSYVAGANLSTNAFSISSSENTATGMNTLSLDYDFALAATGVFSAGTSLDSLSQLSIDDVTPYSLLKAGNIGGLMNYATSGVESNGTIGFGLTYSPIKKLDVQLSMSGLAASEMNFASALGKRLYGNANIDGFTYNSAVGDTLGSAVSSSINDYTETIQNGINSYLGVHYVDRKNSWNDYTYMGINTMLWLGRNVQLKGGYYMAMDELHNDRVNAAVQLRLTPVVQFYIGTTTVGDVATISKELINGRMGIGASTSSINISTGVSMAFFDNRFKKNEKVKKVEAVQYLSPANQEKVDAARKNSATAKDKK